MNIAQSPTREKFPLSTKKPIKKSLSTIITLLVIELLGFIVFALMQFAGDSTTQFLGLFLIISLPIVFIWMSAVYFYQVLYFQKYFYDLTDRFIIIKKGVIIPGEITVPYERVQDIYVNQDLLDRIFGLYDVHLSTATVTSGMEAHIDGLEKEAAYGLRELLLETVHQKISKTQNPSS